MATCLACPCVGHLQQLYRMFGYLKEHTGRKIALDARMPNVSEERFYDRQLLPNGHSDVTPVED